MRIEKCISLFASLILVAGFTRAQDYTAMSRSGYPQSAQTVTNGQAVTLDVGINVLTPTGEADGSANTITLADVAQSNVAYWLVNADTATNLITISKTGNWKAASVTLAAGEAIYIVSTATNALRRGDAGAALAAQVATVEGYFGALGATNITFTSTLQTNVLKFNAVGVLTNHVQTGP